MDGLLEPGKRMGTERQEPLRNLGVMAARLRATGGTGRLALRNSARRGMLHLYFERGQLVHLEGIRATIDDALIDLAGWTEGSLRFDSGVLPERQTLTPEQEVFFQRTLILLQQHGVLAPVRETPQFTAPLTPTPPPDPLRPLSRVTPARLPALPETPQRSPEPFSPAFDPFPTPGEIRRVSHRVPSAPPHDYSGPLPPASPPATTEVLLSPKQWELLVEVVRVMLESVGRLFGQRQAQNILQHVLAERSQGSEVLGLLQVDRHGWLRELRAHELLNQPLQEVATAFVLLISDFERRCAALLGEEKARQMITRALYPYQDALAEIGIALNY